MPLSLPFQVMVSEADAAVVEPDTQLKGLVASDPVALALVTVTALLLVVHRERVAFTAEEPVPPPDFVSGGENDTLADTEQLTEPGAEPENLGSLAVLDVTPENLWALAVLANAAGATTKVATATDNTTAPIDKRDNARRCNRDTGPWVKGSTPVSNRFHSEDAQPQHDQPAWSSPTRCR